MPRLNYGLLSFGLAVGVLTAIGCSGSGSLDTEPVTGVVTVDGTPVAGATVMFTPVTEGQGAAATGSTDENGVYTLTSVAVGEAAAKAGAGTLPGEYFVGVSKSVAETAMSEEEAYDKGVEYKPLPPGQAPKVKYVVPQKYNNPKTSGLKATVESGENDIPLELTSS